MNKKALRLSATIFLVVFLLSLGIVCVYHCLFSDEGVQQNENSSYISGLGTESDNNPSLEHMTSEKSSAVVIPQPQNMTADISVVEDYEDKYFVKRLSGENRYYFCELYRAVSEYKESVSFSTPINKDDFTELMYFLNYDCPELIHLGDNYFTEMTGERAECISKVTFSYCMSEDKYVDAMDKIKIFFKRLVSDLRDKSEYEKEKYVYDYIFTNCTYTEAGELAGSAYGSLIEGHGRCEAYCKGFMWCMRKLGIECICVLGTQNWDLNSMFSEHSWNIVKIDNNWYHVDITVDNVNLSINAGNTANYGFFNVDDSFINESHKISQVYSDVGVPVCESTKLNYHKMNNQFVTSENAGEKLKNIWSEHFDGTGIYNLSVRFESKEDYNRVLSDMNELITEFLKGKSDDRFNYNICYNDLSRTVILTLIKENSAEGE